MSQAFDEHVASYEDEVERVIAFAGAEHALFLEAKARALLSLASVVDDPARLSVLDVGCGNGLFDRHIQSHVGALHGVDVSERMVEAARRTNPKTEYTTYDGVRLPYRDGEFDLAFSVCTFHHVPKPERPALGRELARVVRAGGMVAVAEHNPWNPLTRIVVARCEFDRGVQLLRASEARHLLSAAGLANTQVRFILFAPTLRAGWLRVERELGGVPLGAQYVAAGIKPPAETPGTVGAG